MVSKDMWKYHQLEGSNPWVSPEHVTLGETDARSSGPRSRLCGGARTSSTTMRGTEEYATAVILITHIATASACASPRRGSQAVLGKEIKPHSASLRTKAGDILTPFSA